MPVTQGLWGHRELPPSCPEPPAGRLRAAGVVLWLLSSAGQNTPALRCPTQRPSRWVPSFDSAAVQLAHGAGTTAGGRIRPPTAPKPEARVSERVRAREAHHLTRNQRPCQPGGGAGRTRTGTRSPERVPKSGCMGPGRLPCPGTRRPRPRGRTDGCEPGPEGPGAEAAEPGAGLWVAQQLPVGLASALSVTDLHSLCVPTSLRVQFMVSNLAGLGGSSWVLTLHPTFPTAPHRPPQRTLGQRVGGSDLRARSARRLPSRWPTP